MEKEEFAKRNCKVRQGNKGKNGWRWQGSIWRRCGNVSWVFGNLDLPGAIVGVVLPWWW